MDDSRGRQRVARSIPRRVPLLNRDAVGCSCWLAQRVAPMIFRNRLCRGWHRFSNRCGFATGG